MMHTMKKTPHPTHLASPSALRLAAFGANLTGTQTTNGTLSSGSTDIVLSDATGLVVGQQVTGSRV